MEYDFPLISVIVPIYNTRIYLRECVDSILGQTYKNIEVILVDDGSNDGSSEICDEYAKKDERIVVIHQENRGLVSARINGLRVATGTYATYVDGDDWIDEDTYEKLYTEAMGTKPDIITYAITEEFPQYQKCSYDMVEEGLYSEESIETLRKFVLYNGNLGCRGILSNLVVKIARTELFKQCQEMVAQDMTIGEDTLCTFALFLKANTVYITKRPLYHYRRHNGSMMSSSLSADKCINIFCNLEKIASRCDVYSVYKMQIFWYMYFLALLKRPSMLLSTKDNPYYISKKDRLVLYGAGEFGRELYFALNELKYTIVNWVDGRYESYQQQGLQVQAIDTIRRLEFDYVIIAILNCDIQEEVKRDLSYRGITEHKIRCLRTDEEYVNEVGKYFEQR